MEGNFIQISNHGESINFISSFSGEASGISPQAFYRGCGEPGVPAGQGLTCTVEELFDVRLPSSTPWTLLLFLLHHYPSRAPTHFFLTQLGCLQVKDLPAQWRNCLMSVYLPWTLSLALFVTMSHYPFFFSVWGGCTVEELFDVGLGPSVTLLLALFVTMVFKSAWSDCRSRANSGGTICASKIQNDGNPVVPNFVYVIFDT